MPKRETWKKPAARIVAKALAEKVAELFKVDAPKVIDTAEEFGLSPRQWEFHLSAGPVWTGAGKAELSVRIDSRFAHLYFRFDDPARAAAAGYDDHHGRLNRHSGKWNRIASAPSDLSAFAALCISDFRKVAEPNPDPREVAAWEAKQAELAAGWERYREEMRSGKDHPETTAARLEYIKTERFRYKAAGNLSPGDSGGFESLKLHPLTQSEIAERLEQLDRMEAETMERAQDGVPA